MRILLCLVFFLVVDPNTSSAESNDAPSVQQLRDQLLGGLCMYHSYDVSFTPGSEIPPRGQCEQIPYPSWWNPIAQFSFSMDDRWDHLERNCPLWAATCLSLLGTKGRVALPDLIKARDAAVDYNTGDGIIPTRSRINYVIEYLEKQS